ncbi:MAG TPA: AAA family ATPase [Cyclobacteriaceae bacterium]
MPNPSSILAQKFTHTPTQGQQKLFSLFDSFLEETKTKDCILLRGYAGTGKTSLVSAIVKTLPLFNYKFVLLAPTGRAAKVLSGYARKVAYTIHKKIYKQAADPVSGLLKFELQKNYHKKTVFIIDESSMLYENNEFGDNGILSDLIKYIFNKKGNKLMLIGDSAQLPPVGQSISAALDMDYLKLKCKLDVQEIELQEVMRQDINSGIMHNATVLRESLSAKEINIRFRLKGFKDIFKMTSEKLEAGLRYAYDKYGVENTTVICRSNRAATQYNQFIRRQIFFKEEEIETGDFLMIVKNNYFYKENPAGFMANGDFVEVMKVITFEDLYRYRFATLRLRMIDYPDEEEFEAKVLLNTLHTENTSLSPEENKKFYQEILKDYIQYSEIERAKALRFDPYLNALQIKFSYALTCHKSQGGQWPLVFVDQGYLTEEMINEDYLRWLYTALTRSTKEVYLLNFNSRFF